MAKYKASKKKIRAILKRSRANDIRYNTKTGRFQHTGSTKGKKY